jgi:hypothetical protein
MYVSLDENESMSEYSPMGIDNELLVLLFQRSLTGPALTSS